MSMVGRRVRFLALCIFLPWLAGCGDEGEVAREKRVKRGPSQRSETPPPRARKDGAGPVRITWTGCGISKKAYIDDAVVAYRRETGVEVIVTGGGATRGIRATAGGTSDIGGTCRQALPGCFPEEGGVLLTHVAWDALVFFTHPDNPVTRITPEQAKAVLLGNIRSWKQLGGPDEKIIPAFRQQTFAGKLSGVGYMTRLLLFGNTGIDYRKDAIFHRSSGPVEEFVEATPFSFAVTGVSSARKRKVRMLAFDGVSPDDKENIASGRYALTRPLYLVTRGEPEGRVKDFLDWIVGPRGQKVLSEAGTVNLREGASLKARFDHWPDKAIIRNH